MKIQRLPLLMLLIATTLLAPFTLLARPTLEPLGPNIADIGSAWYHFQTTTLRSADGQRRYKVWLGIPRKPAPPHGYPVLYMLDGNAAMARITEAQLKAMTKGSPPVLVAVGYDTPLPFDVRARSRDYTPPAARRQRITGCRTRTLSRWRQRGVSPATADADCAVGRTACRQRCAQTRTVGPLFRRAICAGYALPLVLVSRLLCRCAITRLGQSTYYAAPLGL